MQPKQRTIPYFLFVSFGKVIESMAMRKLTIVLHRYLVLHLIFIDNMSGFHSSNLIYSSNLYLTLVTLYLK